MHDAALTWYRVFFSLLDGRYLAHLLVDWREFCIELLFFRLSNALIYFENVILVWHALVVSINNFFDIDINFAVTNWSGFERFSIQFWSRRLICRTVLHCLPWLALAYWKNIDVKRFVFGWWRLLILNIFLGTNKLFKSLGYFNRSLLARCLASLLVLIIAKAGRFVFFWIYRQNWTREHRSNKLLATNLGFFNAESDLLFISVNPRNCILLLLKQERRFAGIDLLTLLRIRSLHTFEALLPIFSFTQDDVSFLGWNTSWDICLNLVVFASNIWELQFILVIIHFGIINQHSSSLL